MASFPRAYFDTNLRCDQLREQIRVLQGRIRESTTELADMEAKNIQMHIVVHTTKEKPKNLRLDC